MLRAGIKGIEYYLPANVLDNTQLAATVEKWTPEKIQIKTGIKQRHIAGAEETALDMAEQAAKKLFASGVCSAEDVEYILFCTQSPDYFLPTTACLLQERLNIPTAAGALDFNLGCSGFIYGLSLAKGLIETGQVRNVLLITSETYSKYISEDNANVRTIFGDAAAATFIVADEVDEECIGPFVFGTDGSGGKNLMVEKGAHRHSAVANAAELYMNGPDIFTFTIQSVPKAVKALTAKYNCALEDIDHFVFHQANEYMLSHLRDKLDIPEEKFCIDMADYGNTVSATIPIALSNLLKKNAIKAQQKIMLVGFGVGYSWGATVCRFL